MNPIQYLVSHGFRITSDPTKYQSGLWGKRDYTAGGYNYDSYCGGYHRAYDLSKFDRAPVPAVTGGIVTAGTSSYGNFGGTVVIADKSLGIQVIYGHLARKLPVKIGDTVRQGQTIGYQSNTNYDNVSMASHLHIQFQKYGYIHGERAFVCTGINPLNINIDGQNYKAAWLWTGEFSADSRIRMRDFPSLSGKITGVITPGTRIKFDKLYDNDGHWWVRHRTGSRTLFSAIGERRSGVNFSKTKIWGKIRNLNTSGGKE